MTTNALRACGILAISCSSLFSAPDPRLTPFGPQQRITPKIAPTSGTPGYRRSPAPHGFGAAYGQIPMSFEANAGQAAPEARYVSRGVGYSVFLNPRGADLEIGRNPASRSRIGMRLVNANRSAELFGVERLPGVTNYYVGAKSEGWRTNIPNYARVQQRNVYGGIDLVYYGNQRRLEYDFVVAPGADPGAIHLAFTGTRKLEVDSTGDLLLHTPAGVMRQHRPVLYQVQNGRRTAVEGDYVLLSEREIGFRVGRYNLNEPLVIDPVLSYSTFVGGAGYDIANGVTVDGSGNAYVVGSTNSGFQDRNVFVQKVNSAGSAILYTSYLGGSCDDDGNSVAVDANGNAYVTGRVILLGQFGYCTDKKVFVSKLNPTGTQVYGATFGSAAGDDFGYDIAVDGQGNAYVTGQASYAGFPTTPGSYQPDGYSGAFVSKINAAGTGFVYSTYLGNLITIGYGIAVDALGNAHVAGWTQDSSFPTTPNAAQTAFAAGGTVQAFATKLNASGSALLYSTLLGGNTGDHANEIAIDAQGNMYLTGNTESDNFPTTTGVPDRTCGTDGYCNMQYICSTTGCRFARLTDAFVAKINPALSGAASLVFSTYLGGSNREQGRGIAVGANGTVWVSGITYSSALTFPLAGAIQSQLAGTSDAFISQLNATGTGILFSTYLGGSGEDDGANIAIDSQGHAYVVGRTLSPDFPRLNPIQGTHGGGEDAFLAKLSVGTAAPGLAGLTLNPTTVTGGAISTATVSLTAAAPAGGAVVTLSSSNTAAATVPASVAVAAGATTATFAVTSKAVTGASTATISAVYGGVTKTGALTVNPAALSTLTLNPTTATGGKTSTATVKLTGAAPSGGMVVSLSSNNTAVAKVPASVTVAAGASSATFVVSSVVVTAQAMATITATAAGAVKTTVLTVVPATLSSITASPLTVTGGKNATGSVVLTGAAPTGGIVVTLASSNTALANAPASITVPAGAASVNFTITTTVVKANSPVVISGAYNGVSKSVTLTVVPAVLSAMTVAANPVCGCKNTTGTVTLTGPAPAGGATVLLSDAHPSAAVPASVTVPAGAVSVSFTITTTPVIASQTNTVTASYGGVAKNVNLTVRPIGVLAVSLTPNPVIGGNAVTGTVSLECAAAPAGITVSLSSNQAGVASPALTSITVPAGASSATFMVNTTKVTATSSPTITATANSKPASRVLTVNP